MNNKNNIFFTPNLKRHACSLAASFLMLAAANNVQAATQILPDNPSFQYQGRIDFTDPQKPYISWPATSINTVFTGSELSIILDDERGLNYFNVIVDGDDQHPYVIECKIGQHEYFIASDLGDGKHTLQIIKRTEGEEGGTKFVGIKIEDNKKVSTPAPLPERRIEFYGDSITSGMGNEAADNAADHLKSEKNNYWSYASITGRALKADTRIISQSGIGVMISWFDFIMPQFYDQLSAVGNNESVWDFKQWTPQVVVVNLFQNDSWLIDREKRLKPTPNREAIIKAYIDFIQSIRAKYPDAYIICALGSMDATREGSPWPDYVNDAVRQIKTSDPTIKINSIFFDFNGYGAHPRVHQHIKNAEKLTQFIRRKMNWDE